MKPEIGFGKRYRQAGLKGRNPKTFHATDKMALRTVGVVGNRTQEAFIYLGTDGTRLKAGMTSNLEQRAAALSIEITHSWQVAPAGARAVETEVFQIIGHKQGDTEWIVGVSTSAILDAVADAFRRVRRWAWVDHDLTEDEARQLRIQLAGVDPSAPVEPDRPARRSITSFRKAAGTFGAHGGRF